MPTCNINKKMPNGIGDPKHKQAKVSDSHQQSQILVDGSASNKIWQLKKVRRITELKARLNTIRSGKPQNRASQWCNAFSDMSHSVLQRCWKKKADRGAQLPMLCSAVVSKWGPTQQRPHYTLPGTTPAPATPANKREQEIMEKQRRRESGRERWSTWM